MKSNFIFTGALFALVSFAAAGVSDVNPSQQPAVEEKIKRIHVLNPGEKEYLSPNLIGVQNIAITNIPVTMNFINIIDAYREIVDGVRYEIVLNAVNTTDNNTEVVCRLVVLEKPWLTTLWGDKVRDLQESNCTNEEILPDIIRDRKSIDGKYETNAIFSGSRNELTPDDIFNLESQIISSSKNPQLTRQRAATTTTTTTIFASEPEQVTDSLVVTERAIQPEAGIGGVGDATESIVSSFQESGDSTTTTEKIPELSENEKKWLDDFLSIGAYNFETSIDRQNAHNGNNEAQLNGQDDSDKHLGFGFAGGLTPLSTESLKRAVAELSSSLTKLKAGDAPSLKIKECTSGTTQVVSGTSLKLNCVMVDENNKEVKCVMSLWSQPWLKENRYEVGFKCEDGLETRHRHSRSVEEKPSVMIVGGARVLNPAEVEAKQAILQSSLDKIVYGDAPKMTIVKCHSGTSQLVAGSLVKLNCDMEYPTGKQVPCTMSLWSQPWLKVDGYQVTFECDGDAKRLLRHSRSAEEDLDTGFPTIVGGLTPLNANELKEAVADLSHSLSKLKAGDAPSLKIKECTSGTTQVVSGTSLKLNCVMVDENNKEVKCVMSLWSQPWLKEDGYQVRFNCEDRPESSHRHSRSSEEEDLDTDFGPIVGGTTPLNADELKEAVADMSNSLSKLKAGDAPSLKIKECTSGTTQIVSGTNLELNCVMVDENNKEVKCVMSLWSQPWLKEDGYQVRFNCEDRPESSHRHSRSSEEEDLDTDFGPIVGGTTPLNADELKEAVADMSNSLSKLKAGDAPSLKIKECTSGTTQIVSGTNLELNCVMVDENNKEVKCVMSLWSQPWLKEDGYQVRFNCEDRPESSHRHSRSSEEEDLDTDFGPIVGGTTPLNADELKEAVADMSNSLSKLKAGDAPSLKIKECTSGTTQIVSGTNLELNCVMVDENNKEVKCVMSLWSQPWLKEDGYQVRFNCEDRPESSHRHSRSAEPTEKIKLEPRGAPKVLTDFELNEQTGMVSQSLSKIASGDGPSYSISRAFNGTKQTVAGSLVKIYAELIDGSTGGKENCTVSLWSRPWIPIDGYEVSFKCKDRQKSVHRHSRSVEYQQKKTHKKSHRSLDKAEHLFQKFQIQFKKNYHSTMERQMRLRIFKHNLRLIHDLNKNEMGSAKYGITEFADMTTTEYRSRTGLLSREESSNAVRTPAIIPNVELPKELDWREKGVVSKVKNQGNCGSCWAFSVTGNIEGLHAVKTGKLEEYSEQELLDCDTTDSACNGGLPDDAYKAIEKIGGLELESEYPYEARKGKCHFNSSLSHVKVAGAVDLPKNETAMAQWLIANGPISIGINANAMQFYRGGVSHPWKMLCSKKSLDHGVLIVGYGVSEYPMFKKILPYWIVKNSWGPKWGEQGYYRVYRGDNSCGVSEMASSAVLAS